MSNKTAMSSGSDHQAASATSGEKAKSRHIFDKETGQTFEQIQATLGTSADPKRDDADQD